MINIFFASLNTSDSDNGFFLDEDKVTWGGFTGTSPVGEYTNYVPGIVEDEVLHIADRSGPNDDGWNHTPMMRKYNGIIYLIWPTGIGSNIESPGSTRFGFRYSLDNGATWSTYQMFGDIVSTTIEGQHLAQTSGNIILLDGKVYAINPINPRDETINGHLGIIFREITGGTPGANAYWCWWLGKDDGDPIPTTSNTPFLAVNYTEEPTLSPIFEAGLKDQSLRMEISWQFDPVGNGNGGYQIPPYDFTKRRDFIELSTTKVNNNKYFTVLRSLNEDANPTSLQEVYIQFQNTNTNWQDTSPVSTGIPDSPSRCVCIQLPDGRYAIFGNHVTNPTRKNLYIGFSEPNSLNFKTNNIFSIKKNADEPYPLKYPGSGKSGIWAYPTAIFADGHIHLSYSLHKEDIYYMKIDYDVVKNFLS